MLITLLAAVLLAPPAPDPPSEGPPMTAGQLYDGCVRHVGRANARLDAETDTGAICAVIASVTMAINAAEAAVHEVDRRQPDTRKFCLPESISRGDDDVSLHLVRAFIDYVDRNPASRSVDAEDIFDRAAAEKWPCPR